MDATRYLELALETLSAFGLFCGALAAILPPGKAHDTFQRLGMFAAKKPAAPEQKP
jgi:hypothetical protein